MALITRLARLFRADLHAVLDRIEEPAVLLRQAIREMEEALAGDERRTQVLQHEQGQLLARQAEIDQTLSGIEAELDICFASGKDDLARVLVRRRLEAQRFVTFLTRKREALEHSLAACATRLEENRTRLNSMRQKAELLAEDDTPEPVEPGWSSPDMSVRDEDVEVAFLREKHRRRPS
jgi:phage shock protein A